MLQTWTPLLCGDDGHVILGLIMNILWSLPGTEQQTPETVEEKRASFSFDLIIFFIFMILLPCNGEKKDQCHNEQ